MTNHSGLQATATPVQRTRRWVVHPGLWAALVALTVATAPGWVQSASPRGDVVLPSEAKVFGPFGKDAGVPAAEMLRQVPQTLVIGQQQATARAARFDAARRLDCAPFCGAAVGSTAWVYLAFTAEAAGPATFGFGADWWYEAYLDGKLVSETLSRGSQGNDDWPPTIRDFAVTVELTRGSHVLAVRLLRGSGSAQLAVGGPRDLRNPAIKKAPKPVSATLAKVTKAGYREGPPADKRWKLVWNEEFDGTTLDTAKWNVQPQNEWKWPDIKTKPAPENLFLDGQGALVLQLTRDPDGTVRHFGSINSRFEKAYGYVETRVQFTRQPGWWGAVWMAGYPYDCGVDTFVHSQEFDIFEDFYKPKKQNDISHCYHCSVKLTVLPGDQGNAKGVGEGAILRSTKLGRTSSGRTVVMDDYSGWHTVGFQWTPLEHIFYVDGQETLRQSYRDVPVTNVPQKIWISGCTPTPKSKDGQPFYGRLEEAQFPDRLVVDYVRIYDEDPAPRALPKVTLAVQGNGPYKQGNPLRFDVTAAATGGQLKSLLLFSMGRLRAEVPVDGATAKTTFEVNNLFSGTRNTIIAMARDDAGLVGQSAPLSLELLTGKEFTGTAYQGQPQAIPGTIKGGSYDEGGHGVAYQSAESGPSDARLEFRKTEQGDLPEAVGVGAGRAQWITYEVDVAAAGEYDAELFMNRCDYYTKGLEAATRGKLEPLRLNLGRPGDPGQTVATWQLPREWTTGYGWRSPQKSLGKQRLRLPAGRHKLVLFCDGITVGGTYFCKLVFSPAAAGGG